MFVNRSLPPSPIPFDRLLRHQSLSNLCISTLLMTACYHCPQHQCHPNPTPITHLWCKIHWPARQACSKLQFPSWSNWLVNGSARPWKMRPILQKECVSVERVQNVENLHAQAARKSQTARMPVKTVGERSAVAEIQSVQTNHVMRGGLA